MIELIKVSKNSNVNAVAGSIANIMREQERLYIQVVGAGSLNQAIKALAIARGYLTPSGIDIYMSEGTKEALQVSNHHLKIFKKDSNSRYEVINIGGFKVLAFGTEHDVLEPVGFIVYHKEIGKIAFITDSYYCRYKFKGINYYMVECNYSEDIIPTLPAWRARTLKSHQSLETLKRSLEVYDLSQCKKIILIHVSEGNGDPIRFQKEIQELTGIDTIVAGYGIEI